MSTNRVAILAIAVACAGSGCATTTDYELQRIKASNELPAYEQAFSDKDCFNTRFKFENSMSFSGDDVVRALECLEIEKSRNALRAAARGIIQSEELTAAYGYESYRAIFSYLASGELSLERARELYAYATQKSSMDAQAEIAHSNQLLAQGFENQRRAWEEQNRNRAIFLQSLVQSRPARPTVTTCTTFSGVVTCTTN